jgi:hypothetical protein
MDQGRVDLGVAPQKFRPKNGLVREWNATLPEFSRRRFSLGGWSIFELLLTTFPWAAFDNDT